MKWVLSHKTTTGHHWLLQDENRSSRLIYNELYHSLRLQSFYTKRLFFLENQGLLQKKMVLKTEYGVVIGECQVHNNATMGTMYLNDTKFFFIADTGGLAIYNQNKKMLSNCSIDLIQQLDKFEQSGLLFSFAWMINYDFASREKEALVQMLD